MTTDVPDGPATFADLNGQVHSDGCRRCGEPATHGVSMQVRELGPGKGFGAGKTVIASHRTRLCEKCAVALFSQVRKAMR